MADCHAWPPRHSAAEASGLSGGSRPAVCTKRIQPGEIFSEMHESGLEHLSQVRWALLEADGDLTIIPEQGHGLPVARTRDRDAGL
ncbi:YetF domain-containing protein [Sorangium sp. So ce118]